MALYSEERSAQKNQPVLKTNAQIKIIRRTTDKRIAASTTSSVYNV